MKYNSGRIKSLFYEHQNHFVFVQTNYHFNWPNVWFFHSGSHIMTISGKKISFILKITYNMKDIINKLKKFSVVYD